MNADDILRMAREAHAELLASGRGMHVWHEDSYAGDVQAFCERFAALVAAAEREACAKVCDAEYYQHIGPEYGEVRYGISTCAVAIRARGTK